MCVYIYLYIYIYIFVNCVVSFHELSALFILVKCVVFEFSHSVRPYIYYAIVFIFPDSLLELIAVYGSAHTVIILDGCSIHMCWRSLLLTSWKVKHLTEFDVRTSGYLPWIVGLHLENSRYFVTLARIRKRLLTCYSSLDFQLL